MRTILAPMDGVIDHEMRAVLTGLGGYSRCVTEFVRVNDQVLPERVFLRFAPELDTGGTTPAGVPVYLQLLGGSTKYMALNAARVQKLAPPGIDLNFGCPSKTVTGSDGGSVLLREPNRIGDIVAAVRDAVDPAIPVTAKIRLGFSNHDLLPQVVDRIVAAGASEICVHARTRDDRYKAPAYWSAVKNVSSGINIPIIINGEIWSRSDARQAITESGCQDIMLGRAALTCPDLAAGIQAEYQGRDYQMKSWAETLELLLGYLHRTANRHPSFVSNRGKQWLVFLQRQYPPAIDLFHRIKRMKEATDVLQAIEAYQLSPAERR